MAAGYHKLHYRIVTLPDHCLGLSILDGMNCVNYVLPYTITRSLKVIRDMVYQKRYFDFSVVVETDGIDPLNVGISYHKQLPGVLDNARGAYFLIARHCISLDDHSDEVGEFLEVWIKHCEEIDRVASRASKNDLKGYTPYQLSAFQIIPSGDNYTIIQRSNMSPYTITSFLPEPAYRLLESAFVGYVIHGMVMSIQNDQYYLTPMRRYRNGLDVTIASIKASRVGPWDLFIGDEIALVVYRRMRDLRP